MRLAERFARCVAGRLGRVTVVLYGSYARGDFNEWSDVDVLVVAEGLPRNPLRRLDLVEECMREALLVEPVLVTPGEFESMLSKGNPLILDAVEHGVVLRDDLGLFRRVKGR
ncbi:MAG: nucleotidyltransferase domain-containing protein [Crenarchaeota archaeon]|nr:nucleotidyltransferase domain-containing protein [Thermoproteota archaeon]